MTSLAARIADTITELTTKPPAADRILLALTRGRGDLDLRDEPRPTNRQVAAVLAAMADHAFTTAVLSTQVFDLGHVRANFGYRRQRATGIGRFFHQLADHLTEWDTHPTTTNPQGAL